MRDEMARPDQMRRRARVKPISASSNWSQSCCLPSHPGPHGTSSSWFARAPRVSLFDCVCGCARTRGNLSQRVSSAPLCICLCIPLNFHEPRLLRVERQTVSRKPLRWDLHHLYASCLCSKHSTASLAKGTSWAAPL